MNNIVHHLNAKKPIIANVSNIFLKYRGEYHYLVSDTFNLNEFIKKIENMVNVKIYEYTKEFSKDKLYYIYSPKLVNFRETLEILKQKKHYFYGTILTDTLEYNNQNRIIGYITLIKIANDIPKEIYDPDIFIQKIDKINIIRDDIIIGGTKFRAAIPFIKNLLSDKSINELIYFGASNGIAQLALSYCLYLLKSNVKLTIFFQQTKMVDAVGLSNTSKLVYYNTNYIFYPEPMKLIWPKMDIYASKNKNSVMIPFGLDDDYFKQLLEDALKEKLANLKIEKLWLVAGSATLLSILMKILDKTFFNVVQVGKSIKLDNFDKSRIKLYVSKYRLYEQINCKIPYPTLKSYDGKIWEFANEFQEGDFIWNVANNI